MAKCLKLPVRSLGSEVDDPSLKRIATWIADHHGQEGDLLNYKLEESLLNQEGVDLPAVGGRMYGARIRDAFSTHYEGEFSEEAFITPDQLIADATRCIALKKGLWFSIPAPHLLSVRRFNESSTEEHNSEVISTYRLIMRYMRDAGVKGHVLLCDEVVEEELERLAGKRQLLFCETVERQSLSLLLEYQSSVAVPANCLDLILSMRDEFEISQVIIVDPHTEQLHSALLEYDPDTIVVGGYCRKECTRYWARLVRGAELTLSPPQP